MNFVHDNVVLQSQKITPMWDFPLLSSHSSQLLSLLHMLTDNIVPPMQGEFPHQSWESTETVLS